LQLVITTRKLTGQKLKNYILKYLPAYQAYQFFLKANQEKVQGIKKNLWEDLKKELGEAMNTQALDATTYPPAPEQFNPEENTFAEYVEKVFLEHLPNSLPVGEKLTLGSYEDFRLRMIDWINRVRLEELEAMGYKRVEKGSGHPPDGTTGWFIDIGTPGYNSDRDVIHISPYNMSEEVQTSISILFQQLVRKALNGSLKDTLDVTAFRDHPAKFDTQDKIVTAKNRAENSRLDQDMINLQNYRSHRVNPLFLQDKGLATYRGQVQKRLNSPYTTKSEARSIKEVEELMTAIHQGIREQLFLMHPKLQEQLQKRVNYEQAYVDYLANHPDQFQLARDSYIEPRLMGISRDSDQINQQIRELIPTSYSPDNRTTIPLERIEELELQKKRNGTLIASFYEESYYTCGSYNVVLRYKGGQSTQRKAEKLLEEYRQARMKKVEMNIHLIILEEKESLEPVANDLLASMKENLVLYNEHFFHDPEDQWGRLLIEKSKYSERVLSAAMKLCDMLSMQQGCPILVRKHSTELFEDSKVLMDQINKGQTKGVWQEFEENDFRESIQQLAEKDPNQLKKLATTLSTETEIVHSIVMQLLQGQKRKSNLECGAAKEMITTELKNVINTHNYQLADSELETMVTDILRVTEPAQGIDQLREHNPENNYVEALKILQANLPRLVFQRKIITPFTETTHPRLTRLLRARCGQSMISIAGVAEARALPVMKEIHDKALPITLQKYQFVEGGRKTIDVNRISGFNNEIRLLVQRIEGLCAALKVVASADETNRDPSLNLHSFWLQIDRELMLQVH
jgi:hypothetical protein